MSDSTEQQPFERSYFQVRRSNACRTMYVDFAVALNWSLYKIATGRPVAVGGTMVKFTFGVSTAMVDVDTLALWSDSRRRAERLGSVCAIAGLAATVGLLWSLTHVTGLLDTPVDGVAIWIASGLCWLFNNKTVLYGGLGVLSLVASPEPTRCIQKRMPPVGW